MSARAPQFPGTLGYRVLDRFRPYQPTGSVPFHYVLDEMGAAILAAHHGVSVDQLGYRRDRSLAVAHSQRLAHTVGRQRLLHRPRGGRTRLPRPRPAGRVVAAAAPLPGATPVRPDDYGPLAPPQPAGRVLPEYDRGPAPLGLVTAKLAGYAELAAGSTTPTLFWLPGAPRSPPAPRPGTAQQRVA